MNLTGASSGYLDATLSGTLQALAEHLPATLQIRSEAFKPTASLPDTLQLNQLDLAAKGDLLKGYQLSGTANLPAEQSPIALALSGLVDSKGARLDALDLTASDTQRVKLQATADWQQGLTADAQLDWQDFPWLRLYPLETPPQVTLKRFDTRVHYRDGKYQGTFAGDLDGPAGAFTLASPFEGDLDQVKLPQLALTAGQGKAAGSVAVRFADTLAWDVDLQLSALDPAYWLAELPGTLAGPLRTKGELKDDVLSLDAQLDLKGRLRGQPAVFKAEAQGAGQRWTLGALAIQLGTTGSMAVAACSSAWPGASTSTCPAWASCGPGCKARSRGAWMSPARCRRRKAP